MSDDAAEDIVINLRPIDQMRIEQLRKRTETALASENIWYIHTVLAQCFLPYKDPKTDRWQRTNGDFSILLVSGDVRDPQARFGFRNVGLPYGPKPRLFQSYVCTQAMKQKSPVIPVERSMTAMMRELGLGTSGGKEGPMKIFKEQTTRFAACHFTIVGPGPRGGETYIKAPPIKKFDVWFPANIWYPTEEDVATRPFDPRVGRKVTFGVGAGITALVREIAGYATPTLDRSAKSFVQFLVLIIGLVTAIVAGLPTVFSDATFGSWPDYLAAIALGAASGAGAKGIFETWRRLRRRERVEQPA